MKVNCKSKYSARATLRSIVCLFCLISLFACNSTKFLSDDEALLKKTEIIIEDPQNGEDIADLKLELERFYKQEPNGKWFLLFPREWFWFKHSGEGDTLWYNNVIRKDIAEDPSIYNDDLSDISAENMRLYLKNIKGYFESEVKYEQETELQHTYIQYFIKLGPRYKINSIQYLSKDKSILKIVKDIQEESRLQPGTYIDANIFNQERQKIVLDLQNLGYTNFIDKYIDVKADSTRHEHAFDFFIEILTPPQTDSHQKYTLGEINVYTDYNTDQDTSKLENISAHGKNFHRESSSFIIDPDALDKLIFLKQGEIYDREDRYKTIRKLSSLNMYKFVNVSPFVIPGKDSILNYNITMSPQKYKWVLDYGADLFYSTVNSTNGGNRLFGIAVGGPLQNRNAFGGGEVNSLNTEVAVEFNLTQGTSINTLNIRIQDNIQIPRYVNKLSSLNLANKLGLIKDETLQDIKDEATTNIGAGYNFQRVINFIDISTFNLSYGYNFIPDSEHNISFRQIGLNLNQYAFGPNFPDSTNQLLRLSFENSVFTGFLFRELSYYRKWKQGRYDQNAYTLLTSFEASGLEVYGANKLANAISGNNDLWKVNDDLGFSNFFKLQVDGRYSRQLTEGSAFSARSYFGIVVPYADDAVAPYIKQLSVGGPNSLRAWQSRELGPGSYNALILEPEENQLFYQAGDLKLEFNAEYRFDLIWYVEGAFFIDAGNVWTLKTDPNRPNTKFTSDFLNQFAIGAGWGIRWDFTYFVIRVDFGYKVRNPYTLPEPVYQSPWVFDFKGFGNANIAVNYPF